MLFASGVRYVIVLEGAISGMHKEEQARTAESESVVIPSHLSACWKLLELKFKFGPSLPRTASLQFALDLRWAATALLQVQLEALRLALAAFVCSILTYCQQPHTSQCLPRDLVIAANA